MSIFAKHVKMAIESQDIANSGDVELVDIPEVNETTASTDTPDMLQTAQCDFEKAAVEIEGISDDIVQAQTDVKLIDAGIDLIGVADEKSEMFDIQVTAVEALSRVCRLAQERYGVAVKSPAVESLKGKDSQKAIRAFAKEAEETKQGIGAKIKAAVLALIEKIKAFVKQLLATGKAAKDRLVNIKNNVKKNAAALTEKLSKKPETVAVVADEEMAALEVTMRSLMSDEEVEAYDAAQAQDASVEINSPGDALALVEQIAAKETILSKLASQLDSFTNSLKSMLSTSDKADEETQARYNSRLKAASSLTSKVSSLASRNRNASKVTARIVETA